MYFFLPSFAFVLIVNAVANASCPAGTRAVGSNCKKCQAGRYSSSEHALSCDDCPSGTLSGKGAAGCTSCPSGSYSTAASSSCLYTASSCPSGTYSESSASCTACPPGKASAVIGSQNITDCVFCSPGQHAASSGQTSCSLCAAGTYTPETGSTNCFKCRAGTSLPGIGSFSISDCLTCASGHFAASEGSSKCRRCAAGTFQPAEGSTTCNECSAGSSTNGKVTRTSEDECIGCKDDFVAHRSGLGRCSPCVHPFGCESTSQCAEGYGGESCSQCENGWYLSNDECRECSGRSVGWWIFLLVVIFGLAFAVIYLFSQWDATMASLAISLAHFQLMGMYLLTFRLSYPPTTEWISNYLGLFLTFDVFGLVNHECSGGGLPFLGQWVLSFCVPCLPVVAAGVALTFAVEDFQRLQWGRTIALTFSLAFIHCCTACFQVWACQERSDGTFALQAKPTMTCSSSDSTYVVLAVLGLKVTLTLGGFVGRCLYNLAYREDEDYAEFSGNKRLANPFRVLSKSYKPPRTPTVRFRWSVATLAIKIVALLLGLFAARYPNVQAATMALAAFAYGVVLLLVRPHAAERNNTLDVLNMVLQILHLSVGWASFNNLMSRGKADMILVAALLGGGFVNVFVCTSTYYSDEEEEEEEEEGENEPTSPSPVVDSPTPEEIEEEKKRLKAEAMKKEKKMKAEARVKQQHDWLESQAKHLQRQRDELRQYPARQLRVSMSNDVEAQEQQALVYQQRLQRRYEEDPHTNRFSDIETSKSNSTEV